MASKRQRQRKQAQRAEHREVVREPMHDTARALEVVEKAGSKQLHGGVDTDGFVDLYSTDKAYKPPIPLDSLLTLMETNSTHSGAINAKATDSVGRGWHLEVEDDTEATTPAEPQDADDEDATPESAEEDEAGTGDDQEAVERKLRDWLRNTCPMLKFTQLVTQAYREYDGVGWGFIEVVREGNSVDTAIAELLPVPPQTMRATKIPNVYVQQRGEKRVYFKDFGHNVSVSAKYGDKEAENEDDEANEVIVFKQYSPRSDHYGVPYWISAAPDLAELASIREFNINWFNSGGKVDRIIHVTDGDLEAAKETATSITTKMKESARKSHGHVSVVSYGGEKSEVSVQTLEPKSQDGTRDGSFKVERKELRSQVLVAHQVPPYRVGLAELGSLAGNAAKEMLEAYRFGTIEPGQETFEEILEDTIFNPELGGFDLTGWLFRFNDVDWEEMERDIDAAARAVDAGVATPDEGRAMIGKDPLGTPESESLYYQGVPLVAAGTVASEAATVAAAAAVEKANGVLHELKQALDVIVQAEQPSEE